MGAIEELSTLTAGAVMTEDLITLRPEMSLREAVGIFLEHRISGAPVLDDQGRAIGVLSLTDAMRHFQESSPDIAVHGDFYNFVLRDGPKDKTGWARGFHECDGRDDQVASLMTPMIIAVDEDTPLGEAASVMWTNGVHRLLVRGKGGRLAGILTSVDLVRVLAESLGYMD